MTFMKKLNKNPVYFAYFFLEIKKIHDKIIYSDMF